jgi:hypothetical protein
MARKALIQIRRGLESAIGTLEVGELGYCTDTSKLYIGTPTGNVLLVAAQSTGDMLKSIYDTNNDGKVDYASVADSVIWSGVAGKPSTFPPSAHTHDALIGGGHTFINSSTNTGQQNALNPLWYALRSGKQLYLDEEFANGRNGISPYNNSGGTGVELSLTNQTGVPNATGNVIEVRHNGNVTSPNLGGVVLGYTAKYNAVFVQLIRAKLPVGYTLNPNSNPMGTSFRDYFMTNPAGTGKWETYIRVTMCGYADSLSSGGHVSVSGPAPTASSNLVWQIASATVFELTDNTSRIPLTWNQLKGV